MPGNTPEKMFETMLANLPEKTGKSLDAWLRAIAKSRLSKHGEIVKWLKTEHGITHGFANLIAHKHLAGSETIDLVDAQYAGAKQALRPIYNSICRMVRKFGDDIDVSPRKTYVTLRRNKQFALIKPSTKNRIDVGIKLRGVEETGRLEKSGGFNAMVSHRVRITNKSQVDNELEQWLLAAYEEA